MPSWTVSALSSMRWSRARPRTTCSANPTAHSGRIDNSCSTLFGYLIAWNLRLIVKLMSRAPDPVQHGFAAGLDGATRPFPRINYRG
jgi:hypothetical protein